MSTDRFIIVVEVDNKRALAAFSKGLEELNVIWPLIMERARLLEEQDEAELEALLAPWREEEKAALARYEKELAAWRAKKRYMFSLAGEPPFPPVPTYPTLLPIVPIRWGNRCEKLRKKLQHMVNIAGAATAPYRMTEGQVSEMIAWENGTRITEITNWANGLPGGKL